jgi:amino acid transporter
MAAPASAPPPAAADRRAGGELARTVGFWGLMFVSLGSIIGSGWLLSALSATQTAGPAAIISWVLAAVMLSVLALVYAELGAAYPVAGGSGRFPFFSHGSLAGFIAAYSSWLQAVAIAPIEILGAITYVNSVHWVQKNFDMIHLSGSKVGLLNDKGLVVAAIGMVLFTAMNLAGAKFMSESNGLIVIWKTLVPLLALIVVASLSFHPGNFHSGGGFLPFGTHGIFAALPVGVVFALQGFEQAVQLAGEAKDPQKDLSRAILTAMAIGATLYILLQAAFILAVKPSDVAQNWNNPLGGGAGDYGAWYTLALAVGTGWLGTILIIDSVVSPCGTGIVYVGTTARLSYALGEMPELPTKLASTDRRGVPVWSIIVTAVVGLACFGPFPSWNKLVNLVTDATAIMYAFAPIALGALHKSDADRPRSYRMPMPQILLPAAFSFAGLLIYWGGFEFIWKIDLAIVLGLVLFYIGTIVKKTYDPTSVRHGYWVVPWLIGLTIISYLGEYGDGSKMELHKVPVLHNYADIVITIVFSLVIYYWAVAIAMPKQKVQEAIEWDRHHIESGDTLAVPIA